MRFILLVATIQLLVLLIVNCGSIGVTAQYTKTSLYDGSTCSNNPPVYAVYTPTSQCNTTSCTKHPSLTNYYYINTCLTSVPSTPTTSNTFMISAYSDSTSCSDSTLVTAQAFPMDTCVSISSTSGSMKTSGCNTLTTYSDTECKTSVATVDFSSYRGTCKSGAKYTCSNVSKSSVSMMIVLLISVVIAIVV